MRKISIFDTTLRDGLKSPGTILSTQEKLRIAKKLARLRVDVLEIGFPAASPEQFEAAEHLAGEISGPVVAALVRPTNPRDFEIAWKALQRNPFPRLHTFAPASHEYRRHFLGKGAAETRDLAVSAIQTAKQYTPEIEFSLMDAFRADTEELLELVGAAVAAGAGTINFADTVGYATPFHVVDLFRVLRERLQGFDRVAFSVHCHNDLGLAVANSLAAVAEGAVQVHCTVNGIGERAGNTALEELVAVLAVHGKQLGVETGIELKQIYPASRLVRRLTGISLRSHKPVVGANVFTQEVLVPQISDTVEKPPYATLRPEQLGVKAVADTLTVQTGMNELQDRLQELGYELEGNDLAEIYRAFQELAEKKEQVFDADLELLVSGLYGVETERYRLRYLKVSAGSIGAPNATVQMEIDGQVEQLAEFGHGPVDAAFRTIFKLTKRHPRMVRYELIAATPGSDAQGEVAVRLDEDGYLVNGRAVDTDIVMASAKALVDGLNKLDRLRGEPVVSEFTDDESLMPLV